MRVLGTVLVLLGIALAVVSGFAETLGIGVDPNSPEVVEGRPTSPEFGWKQILGLALGAVLVIVGLVMALRRPGRSP